MAGPRAAQPAPPSLTPSSRCDGCGAAVPLRTPMTDDGVAPLDRPVWLCAGCGLPIAAQFIEEELLRMGRSVRLDAVYFDTSRLAPIQESLRKQLVESVDRNTQPEVSERRRSERTPQSIVAPAVRLGEGLCPVGKPFNIVIANISKEGVGLLHSDRLFPSRLAIQLPSSDRAPIQLIVQVVRDRPLGYPFYEVGGEFLVRLGDCPKDLAAALGSRHGVR